MMVLLLTYIFYGIQYLDIVWQIKLTTETYMLPLSSSEVLHTDS